VAKHFKNINLMDELLIPETLLDDLIAGRQTAFRLFYDMAYPVVYKYVRLYISDSEDCKDVVSEVFYMIWKNRHNLLSVNNFKSWLFIVSRNEAFHFLKKKEKYRFVSIDDMPIELQIDVSEANFIDAEMLAVYQDAVNALPERCKMIFLLAKEENMKYREIAEICSVTEGTVAQQMNIAIRKITETVKRHYK